MANLGQNEGDSVPAAVREELEAIEAEAATATGTIEEPVAPAAPAPDDFIPVQPEQPANPDLQIPEADPLFDVPQAPGQDTVLAQGLQLGDTDTAPPPDNDVVAEKDAEIERLQQRNRTLQGKYDAEVPRLSEALRESKEALREVEAKRSDDLTPEKVSQMSDAEFQEKFNVSEDQLAYGRDMLEFSINQNLETQRVLREQVLRPFEEQKFTDGQQRMRDELGRFMPNWEAVNKSEPFLRWLNEHPAEQRVLEASEEELDAKSAADVLKRYAGVSGQVDAHRTSLDSQITPSPASSAVGAQVRNGAQAGPKPVSFAQVDARMDDLIKGVRPDGTRITETEKRKELAVLDAITGGTSPEYTLAP